MNADRLLAHYEKIADAPDAIARLRRFILDLAVRGKLVPQDAKDEPASDLLKRIAKEKARLVKAGDLRKPRELDGGNELDEPFVIPLTWRWVRLDAIGAIVGGGTPSASDAENFADPGEGVPWLTPADLGGYSDLYISRGSRDLSEKGSRTSSATVMPKGTVLFTSRAPIGYVAIAANAISTNQGFKSIVPYVEDCSRFIATAMKTFAPGIDAKAPGTTFKEVSGKIVAAVPFPLPPLAEQHRIVAKVDELMGLCDRLEAARAGREAARDRLAAASLARLNAPDPATFEADARFALGSLPDLTTRPDQIRKLRQTILNLAVRGKLVPQDPNDEPASELLKRITKEIPSPKIGSSKVDALPYDVPTNWVWTMLGILVVHSDAGWSPKTEDFPRSGDEWGVLKVSAVSWDKFRAFENKQVLRGTEARRQAQVKRGDFLISRANTAELIARAVIVEEEPVKLMMSDKIVRLLLSENCHHRFVWIVNNYAAFARAHYVKCASGVSPSMKNVSRDVILGLPFPLPPLAEQRRIVAKVDELMALCDQLEASLNATSTVRRRLLDALLAEALAPTATDALPETEDAV
jgi:type I restriction enzyme S subunit